MRLALTACGAAMPETFTAQASRAWGGLGFVRNRRAPLAGVSKDEQIERALKAYAQMRAHALPADAFPAIPGYLSLTPGYAGGVESRPARRVR